MTRAYLNLPVVMTGLLSAAIAGLLVLALLAAPAGAATVPDYTTAYTITVNNDGSADWQVEYRTLLATDADVTAFNEYAGAIGTTYLPQMRDLMERSSAQAAVATSRPMAVSGFSGTADIQTSPTGRYGVILYSFIWAGFAKSGGNLVIGDAFAGGMYLTRDDTLTIRYPAGYSVKTVEPAPDRTGDALTWYGQRSFGSGQPLVVLAPEGSSVLVLVLGTAGGAAAVVVVLFVLIRRRRTGPDEPETPAPALSDAEMLSVGERIMQLIRSGGGEMYQSEIVRSIGLPKSTVSSALNSLHARGLIRKVKKGRENLIRLV